MTVLHSTFTLERTYPAPPPRVFAAWADPVSKARWFAGPGAEHALDFRVGGQERVAKDGLRFEATYADITADERIVYSGTMYAADRITTLSLTTVQFEKAESGTKLVLTEQGTYLDGQEHPTWREQGTGSWLDALVTELQANS
ncbi:SRPBCC family protein [Tenggerimyces flavus]|uniref:SRPBCC family protein n=1 Tax=Tenggerimyces flavus TaxID=1708749 RepID=A0ABV7YM70_9ACTN|nr:SRPBCC family protein [Tenggerimyces flavus]MBM7788717.1 uncharacterized protein YndB with AHSA1/START domain [Tenggerimyces flavus]